MLLRREAWKTRVSEGTGPMTVDKRWLQPGDPAPSFVLPAVNRDGAVSLDDYRGRSSVLVGLFRGLH